MRAVIRWFAGSPTTKQLFSERPIVQLRPADIGAYYADYVALMAHFDDVLPGRVHRVVYEDLVAIPRPTCARCLDYRGLLFDERCLRFFENGGGAHRQLRTGSPADLSRGRGPLAAF